MLLIIEMAIFDGSEEAPALKQIPNLSS
jgi:hypothetical protein